MPFLERLSSSVSLLMHPVIPDVHMREELLAALQLQVLHTI